MSVQGALAYTAAGALVGLTAGVGINAAAASLAAAQIAARNGGSTQILGFVTGAGGKVTAWLEQGASPKAGFGHILESHAKQFRDVWGRTLSDSQIKDIVLQAAAKAGRVGTHIVEVVYKGIPYEVKIVIARNGFIVTAHPWSD